MSFLKKYHKRQQSLLAMMIKYREAEVLYKQYLDNRKNDKSLITIVSTIDINAILNKWLMIWGTMYRGFIFTSLIAFSLNILPSSVSFVVCDFSLHL